MLAGGKYFSWLVSCPARLRIPDSAPGMCSALRIQALRGASHVCTLLCGGIWFPRSCALSLHWLCALHVRRAIFEGHCRQHWPEKRHRRCLQLTPRRTASTLAGAGPAPSRAWLSPQAPERRQRRQRAVASPRTPPAGTAAMAAAAAAAAAEDPAPLYLSRPSRRGASAHRRACCSCCWVNPRLL